MRKQKDDKDKVRLDELLKIARQKAIADLLGLADPFSAVQWMRTLPEEAQQAVEEAIIDVYHNY